MADEVHGVFVFGDDPVPGVYVSLSDASGDLEAIDVKNGVYEALFTVDGRRVRASTSARSVVLEVTTERDLDELCERLHRWAVRGGLKSDRVTRSRSPTSCCGTSGAVGGRSAPDGLIADSTATGRLGCSPHAVPELPQFERLSLSMQSDTERDAGHAVVMDGRR